MPGRNRPKHNRAREASRAKRPVEDRTARFGDEHPKFSFRFLDLNGPWGWSRCGAGDRTAVLDFLVTISSRTWAQLRQPHSGVGEYHAQSFDSLEKAAQERASEIKLDEKASQLTRFRLGEMQRLWGFEQHGVFYLVWWDPDHTVYIVPKR
ncbi:hypothetical protein [Candidatus Poriferisodalis sp.]|uniref:hypothetical protein n=1 Tax=Candidatus Poriferisodalis sp. TaxID=3101277 RepID=UPI003B01D749